jgi:hypothetical protein
MKITITDQDMALMGETPQGWLELLELHWGTAKDLTRWVRESAEEVMGQVIFEGPEHSAEEHGLLIPAHEGTPLFEVEIPVQRIFRGLKVWFLRELPEEWQEARATIEAAIESGRVHRELEIGIWDVLQNG